MTDCLTIYQMTSNATNHTVKVVVEMERLLRFMWDYYYLWICCRAATVDCIIIMCNDCCDHDDDEEVKNNNNSVNVRTAFNLLTHFAIYYVCILAMDGRSDGWLPK